MQSTAAAVGGGQWRQSVEAADKGGCHGGTKWKQNLVMPKKLHVMPKKLLLANLVYYIYIFSLGSYVLTGYVSSRVR
jgi:hypothetical protein